MLALLSIYFNLVLSYASGIVPLGYNFRTGRFEVRRWAAALATTLVVVWLALNFRHKKSSIPLTTPRVGMQSTIGACEYIVLCTSWVLIGVQQLLHLENYQHRLSELLSAARSWERRQVVSRTERVVLLLKLVLLPIGLVLLNIFVLELLASFRVSFLHAFLTMVTLIPNMAHLNNFYALLFAQRLTLREINGKLAHLWEERSRLGRHSRAAAPAGERQVEARLQDLLRECMACGRNVELILQLYSFPVVLYLLLLIQEIISKLFYQFTFFYWLAAGISLPPMLEVCGTGMVIIYVTEIVFLFSLCNDISEQSRHIKSAVHRLSLIPRLDERVQEMIKLFLLTLNHAPLRVRIAGMFTMDYETLVGMVSTCASFVVFLAQYHIDFTNTMLRKAVKNKH